MKSGLTSRLVTVCGNTVPTLFNARIKNFNILASKYRGNLHFHHYVFHSVVNMLQLDIEVGNRMFQINYNDKKL